MKNIKDLKQNEVIKCETQQEWDAVCDATGLAMSEIGFLQSKITDNYGETNCIHVVGLFCISAEFAKKQGWTIYQASDFLPQKTADLTGCWVRCIDNKYTPQLTSNKWYQIIDDKREDGNCYFKTIHDRGVTYWFLTSRFDLTDPRKENPDEVKPEIDFTKLSMGEFEPIMEDKIKMVENMIQVEWLKDYDKARLEMVKEFVKGKVGEI